MFVYGLCEVKRYILSVLNIAVDRCHLCSGEDGGGNLLWRSTATGCECAADVFPHGLRQQVVIHTTR